MQQTIQLLLGILVLTLGFSIGNWLAKLTTEELKSGRKWFVFIITVSLVGSVVSLILRNDYFFFSFLFIAIVTSRSLRIMNRRR
ncbi:hypothetical protein COU59_01480 [Candidatus Pacearchaeota archaeon CG10_big_fil_rev_8_21_14_0_10_34_12]|nr:MAG: hypothetical protein COU59_01480 [Candidatus Pacearchaeota archaeon CG10_big_fil_rev_8_21_14_0_10_34_12]